MASVVKVNITPTISQKLLSYADRTSDGVRDSIYHRIVAMDYGDQQFILVSSYPSRISPSLYERVAKSVESKTGINKNDFWWTFTHTHSGSEAGSSGIITFFFLESDRYVEKFDEKYTDFVVTALIEGILSARNTLVPARLGIGWEFSRANINRRGRNIDNKIFLGENPDGPIDRKIGIIRIVESRKNTLALIANYPIHGTVLPPTDTRISGDVPGVVSEYVENKIGAPILFINSAEGDIAPHYSVSVGIKSFEKADKLLNQFRVLLGDKLIDANNRIKQTTDEVIFKTDRVTVETPMKVNLINIWPKSLSDYTRISSTGEHLIKFPVSNLFINDDVAIWGTPCELFCVISNYIRANSPFPNTFYFGLTNGSLAYFPTKAAVNLGGYEVNTSPFTKYAEEDLINSVTNYLYRISSEE